MNEEILNKISYAKKVVVSLIKSSLYNENSVNADDELKFYFNLAKKFRVNDVFHLKSIQETSIYAPFDLFSNINKLYFLFKRPLYSI